MPWTSHPVARIRASLPAPGDKSCSHRALILSGLAEGRSEITGLLEGEDVLRTADAMRALGAEVEQTGPGAWRVEGVGARGLQSPADPIDFGNSGTGSRLMMGALSGYALSAQLTGDASLSKRPMDRVIVPLSRMGARFDTDTGQTLPLTLHGRRDLSAIDYTPPQASAQVKSSILLAALNAEGTTKVREGKLTRDHTERMLRGFGADVGIEHGEGGARTVSLEGGQRLHALDTAIPGDPSSAAFLAAAAVISPDGDILIEQMMSNETRDGFFAALAMMGAAPGAEETGNAAGERLIDVQLSSASLKGCDVPKRLVPAMIDEFPILAVCAAFASGVTRVTGAHELRVKESDRIAAIMAMLRANGVEADETEDGFAVEGCGGPPPGGGHVETFHDHRIAMSALVMGTASQKPVSVDDISMIATSYPGFLADMQRLGADIREA